jgi:hypothetical protein
MAEIIGGCLCGKVRYTTDTAPVVTAICHCKNCQKQSGAAFSVVVGIPKDSLKVAGSLKTFKDTSDDGRPVYRRFCSECGSPILTDETTMPSISFIKAGSLDDTSWLKPTIQIFCDSAQPWVPLPDGAQKFARMPAG